MGVGDTAVNLAAAGLVLNAWILTGDTRYRDWIDEYVGAWRERAAANDGIVPDNVGPDGVVGGLLDGRWYGGHYGWSWPHGWYSVGHAAIVAALAAATATGDDGYLDLVRPALDEIIAHGKVMAFAESDSCLPSKWVPQLGRGRDTPDAARAVPVQRPRLVRLQPDAGVPSRWPCGTTAGDPADRQRLERPARAAGIRLADGPLLPQQGGGRARGALVRVPRRRRPGLPREDPRRRPGPGAPPAGPHGGPTATGDVAEADIHLWQQSNPVVTEALVQLTWGGPQVIYNGGLQQARVRYYDADARRPGLPAVGRRAGLQHRSGGHRRRPGQPRPRGEAARVIVQAGAFAEHTIRRPCATPPARTAPGSATSTTTGTASRRSSSGTLTSGAVAHRPAARLDPHPADPQAGTAHPEAVLRRARSTQFSGKQAIAAGQHRSYDECCLGYARITCLALSEDRTT